MSGPDEGAGVYAQRPVKAVRPNTNIVTRSTAFWGRFYATLGRQYVVPGTFESRKSFLAMCARRRRQSLGAARASGRTS